MVPDQPPVDAPESTARFRRFVALTALALNLLIAGALLVRMDDPGPNATEILSWIVLANGIAILGAVGFKAWESIALLRGGRRT